MYCKHNHSCKYRQYSSLTSQCVYIVQFIKLGTKCESVTFNRHILQYSVHCTVQSVQCTVYIVECLVYNSVMHIGYTIQRVVVTVQEAAFTRRLGDAGILSKRFTL